MRSVMYFDHAAATPVHAQVLQAMRPYWQAQFGNPSSITSYGVTAQAAVEASRDTIAQLLGAHSDEIIFTGSGTESANLALKGILESSPTGHLITTTIEHHAVLEPARDLLCRGYQVSFIPVDTLGCVNPDQILGEIRPETRLVSVMLANNEIGTIEPVALIGRLLRHLNRERAKQQLPPVYLHTDACQAPSYLPLKVAALGVDALTVNASKIGGPKGVGLLYARRHLPLRPQIVGGGQERGRRAGTENVSGIVGCAAAFALAQREVTREAQRIGHLRDRLYQTLREAIPELSLNGHPTERLANHLSLTLPGIDAETLILYLDALGLKVGSGAACAQLALEPSHVLRAIGLTDQAALSTIRLTLGRTTTRRQVETAADLMIKRIRWLESFPHPTRPDRA